MPQRAATARKRLASVEACHNEPRPPGSGWRVSRQEEDEVNRLSAQAPSDASRSLAVAAR